MPRVSPDFKSLRDLNWNAGCLNWTSRLRICYRLTHAFASLHLRRGYAYCDLSSSNIFCQPATGDIRIIDTDNLAIDGYPNILGIIGTPRYMAPELHRGSTQQPSILTDLHSLAVLIFETLLLHHPLLGDRVLEGPPELEDKVLGSHPVYIYHPQDKSNRYTKYQEFGGLLPTVLPQRLLQLFNETFVHGIKNPQLRVRETRWQRALVDSLDEVIPCSNKQCNFGGTFLRGKPWNTKCDWCGSPFKPFLVLKFLGRRGELLRAKVITGTERLAAHHCKLNEPLNFSPGDACAQVEEDPQHGLTLRNISKETLLYRPPAGESFAPFPPEKRIILREGTRIQFGAAGAEAEVVA
ncbi:MAG: hypothetical protein HY669_03465 [Chloroflexi bacterium]|nr:hypothetical protein [Chloroflexota bacterium]